MTDEQLDDLIARLNEKAEGCARLAELKHTASNGWSVAEIARLKGKAEGVLLALSFLARPRPGCGSSSSVTCTVEAMCSTRAKADAVKKAIDDCGTTVGTPARSRNSFSTSSRRGQL